GGGAGRGSGGQGAGRERWRSGGRKASAAAWSAPEGNGAAGARTQLATSAITIGPSRSRNSMWYPFWYQANLGWHIGSAGKEPTKCRIGAWGTISSFAPYITNSGVSSRAPGAGAASIRSTRP